MKKRLLVGAMLMAVSFGMKAQEQILTSFEESETSFGYTVSSDIAEYDSFWGTYNSSTEADVDSGAITITDAWASDGSQSLYFPAQLVGSSTTVVNYAYTNILDYSSLSYPYSIGADISTDVVDTSAGSNMYLEFYSYGADASESNITGYVVYNYDGDIYAYNFESEGYEVIGSFTGGETSNIKFRIDAEDTVSILVDGEVALTYTVDGISTYHYSAFGTDDWGTDYFVDRLTVTQETAGVKNNTLTGVSIYPNPSNSVVNIANVEGLNNISVIDINGRTVKTAGYTGVASAQVNISDLANGVYMMTINSDKGSVTKKVVKN